MVSIPRSAPLIAAHLVSVAAGADAPFSQVAPQAVDRIFADFHGSSKTCSAVAASQAATRSCRFRQPSIDELMNAIRRYLLREIALVG